MGNIKGNSAAVYSAVNSQKLNNANFKNYDYWEGESYFIEDNKANIEEGMIYQKTRGANKNEIWLFSVTGQGTLQLSVSFIDYHNNAILSSTEEFNISDKRYLSTYGVAPERANSILVRISGQGVVYTTALQHLKPLIILNKWSGIIQKEGVRSFEGKNYSIRFRGEAEEARQIDSINFNTFQDRTKIFIGFMSNKSLFNRIEGNISNINNLGGRGKITFECKNIKIPFRDF